MALYYIAIKKENEVVYIYRSTEPKLNDYIIYNNERWQVVGYMDTSMFNDL